MMKFYTSPKAIVRNWFAKLETLNKQDSLDLDAVKSMFSCLSSDWIESAMSQNIPLKQFLLGYGIDVADKQPKLGLANKDQDFVYVQIKDKFTGQYKGFGFVECAGEWVLCLETEIKFYPNFTSKISQFIEDTFYYISSSIMRCFSIQDRF